MLNCFPNTNTSGFVSTTTNSSCCTKRWNFCPECSQKLELTWKYCVQCGKMIETSHTSDYTTYQYPNSTYTFPTLNEEELKKTLDHFVTFYNTNGGSFENKNRTSV